MASDDREDLVQELKNIVSDKYPQAAEDTFKFVSETEMGLYESLVVVSIDHKDGHGLVSYLIAILDLSSIGETVQLLHWVDGTMDDVLKED